MKAYKFKVKRPPKRIVQAFEQTLSVCRELYNAALQERRDAYKKTGKSVNYCDQANQLIEIKAVREDIAGLHSQVVQDVLRRTERTYDAFFQRILKKERAGFPRFKPKSGYNSFTYPQSGFRLEGDKLHLSKIGSIRLRLSRPVEGKIKTCSVKRQVEGWFVIFTAEENQSRYIPRTGEAVGIDVGIENFCALSTGEIIENPHYLSKAEHELKIAQRKVTKKIGGGSNRSKAIFVLAKKHLKVANQRRDFFYKSSLHLIRKFDQIVVEDLNIRGMVKNNHLAKSIGDAAWGTFINILSFKAESAGRKVMKVQPQFTSQDCSNCGVRAGKALAVREHRCIICGFAAHRDVNAAKNILARAEPLVRVRNASLSDPRILAQ